MLRIQVSRSLCSVMYWEVKHQRQETKGKVEHGPSLTCYESQIIIPALSPPNLVHVSRFHPLPLRITDSALRISPPPIDPSFVTYGPRFVTPI